MSGEKIIESNSSAHELSTVARQFERSFCKSDCDFVLGKFPIRVSVNAYDCSVMIGDFKSFLNVNDLSILEVNV